MGDLFVVTADAFQSEVLQSKTPVVVEFGAVWCAPCKMLEPILKQLMEEWGQKARVVKMDVDESADIVMKYQVMSVPTVILFKNGQPLERLSGFQPKDKLVGKITPHLG